jgi:hypothetical protein
MIVLRNLISNKPNILIITDSLGLHMKKQTEKKYFIVIKKIKDTNVVKQLRSACSESEMKLGI